MSQYYGNLYPTLRTQDGHDVLLAHVQAVYVSVGQDIPAGTHVADIGTLPGAPYSTGCHLHFEVRPAGGAYKSDVNPWPWFDPAGVGGWWVSPTPSDGTSNLINGLSLPVKAHVQDHTGTGLSRTDFTWSVEGSGQWSKSSIWYPISDTDVGYNISMPIGGWPTSLIISFDVYANNGKANLAPDGMRRVCRTDITSCPTVTQVAPGNIGGGGGGGGQTTGCVPGSNQVSVFVDPNFGGDCVTKDFGDYSSPSVIGLPNDSISSVRLGSGASAVLCKDDNFSNTCQWVTSDKSDLTSSDPNDVGNDQTSSMRVQSGPSTTGCSPGSNQVSVYIDPNFQGGCITKDIGDYSSPTAIGLPNDSISSVRIGGGAKATLCRDDGFSNTCEDFTSDDGDLSNNSVGDNQVSSMRVQGGQPTTGCSPSPMQVAFFVDSNYNGTCIIRTIGDYGSPSAIGLPNDSISSLRVGLHVKVMICRDDNFSNTCEWYENDDNDLSNNSIGDNQVSSARVISRGHVALCDNTNYGGECHWYYAGDTGINYYNMPDQGFNDRAESIYYEPGYEGQYHVVAYTDVNQSGALLHTDNSIASLSSPYNNSISSIQIYKNQPSGATTVSPANGAKFPSTTTDVDLSFNGGDSGQVYAWNDTGTYSYAGQWQSSHMDHLSGLAPGRYFWQARAQNFVGIGPWSDIASFTINTPPQILGGTLSIDGGTTQAIQINALDNEQDSLTLTANNLPSFATFTDNLDGTGTLTLAPSSSTGGQFTINLTANDGELNGTSLIAVTVTPTADPPVAALSVSPGNGVAPLVVTADASASAAGTNPIANYTFDFGDGTIVGPQAGTTTSHTYALPGSYSVTVTVADDMGLTSSAAQTVDISTAPPVASLSLSPSSGTAPVSVTADASGSTAGTYPISSYTFDFGDSTMMGPQAGSSATHTYVSAGTFTVTVTAIDDHGNTASASKSIIIANPTPPTANFGLTPTSGYAPLNITANASTSTPGSNPITAYTFDFGDGTIVGPQAGSSASHTYTVPGTYTVTLTVRDSIGLIATSTKTITVSLAPLVFENFQSGIGNWAISKNVSAQTSGANTFLRFVAKPKSTVTASRAIGSTTLSPYSKITLRINLNGAMMPSGNNSQFYLQQGTNTYVVSLSSYVTQGLSGWQTITVPVSDFVGFDKTTTITSLGFSFSTSKNSTFDVDDITFTN